jgi:hypothetical protein
MAVIGIIFRKRKIKLNQYTKISNWSLLKNRQDLDPCFEKQEKLVRKLHCCNNYVYFVTRYSSVRIRIFDDKEHHTQMKK